MKCKDCYARNGEEICLIGKKSRMLVCGRYGCDMHSAGVEKRMGIIKPQTHADQIRAMTDEELARWIINEGQKFGEEFEGYMSLLDWLRQEAEG